MKKHHKLPKKYQGKLWRSHWKRKVNVVQTGFYWKDIMSFLAIAGLTLINTVPMITETIHVSKKVLELVMNKMEEQIEEIPEIDDQDQKARKLRYYHFLLDQNEDEKDHEDMYQEYVWKVDKILRTELRKDKIYMKVLWKQGNRSWISLNNLRLHDPYCCVLYAVKKKLLENPR